MATWPYFSSFSSFVRELLADTGSTFSMFSDVFTMFTNTQIIQKTSTVECISLQTVFILI